MAKAKKVASSEGLKQTDPQPATRNPQPATRNAHAATRNAHASTHMPQPLLFLLCA